MPGSPPPPCAAALDALSTLSARENHSTSPPGISDLSQPRRSGPLALVVARMDASKRRWPSAPTAATILRRAGARVVFYSDDGSFDGGVLTLVDGLALFAAADIVVAAHGAALTNALVLRPGAIVLEIAPAVSD